MILNALSIALSIGAALALWFGYDQLASLRGTVFWEFRFIVFAAAGFLGLSALEAALGWVKHKFNSDNESH